MAHTDDNTHSDTPLLPAINSPADLRRLDRHLLPQVCGELRDFLISHLSRNPGHFASSMGSVELTVALHYVFDTPRDRIVWDVGHQAYSHKILTGRRDRFDTNRCYGGLSGFPNPDESEYDTFIAGHASNSISVALGMAVAAQLSGDNRHVIAVIGDAAIAGGLAFEGLNNASNTPNNLLIILNDNDMSIDKAQGALHSYFARLTASRPYNSLRHNAYQGLKRLRLVSDKSRGAILRFNNAVKSLLSRRQNIFEGLNIRYFGPFDGHDINGLIKVLNTIKDMQGPRILHLRTIKGKGFQPAELDPSTWHAPGKFDPEHGTRIHSSSKPKYQEIFGQTLVELARVDNRIVGITAAMPSGTSLNMLHKVYPHRTFDVGISEGHAVTFAGGLAKEGQRPFVAIYSSFLQRAFDNVIHDTAIGRLPVVYCIDRAGLVGEDGVTHHGTYDMAYLSAIPGMTVCAPSSGQMLTDLMSLAAATTPGGPIAIRYPRGTADSTPDGLIYTAPIYGKSIDVITPSAPRLAMLSIGVMLNSAVQAARMLARQGIDVSVTDMVYLKPLDTTPIDRAIEANIPIITLEDGSIIGGLHSAVASYVASKGASIPVKPIAIPDRFVAQGTIAQLRKSCGMDVDSIVNTAISSLSQPPIDPA